MVPSDYLHPHFLRLLFRHLNVTRSYFKTLARHHTPPIWHGNQLDNFARRFAIASQQSTTTFVRICLDAVRLNSSNNPVLDPQCRAAPSSPLNRSLKYFSPESGKIVTITARWPLGKFRATSRHAQSAPPELTPARIPSSRASRFTIRCASSVRTTMSASASFGS